MSPVRQVLMVAPEGFGFNPDTAYDNAFQRPADDSEDAIEKRAAAEFCALRAVLEERGIGVVVFSGRSTPPDPPTPDGVFPNNWFTTHPDGSLVLYPLRAPSRRPERRAEVLRYLTERASRTIDLRAAESDGLALEGTGSLVIDERERLVYASLSPRTSAELVELWAERLDYRPVVFQSRDRRGRAVYHTNVMLSVGEDFAVVCTDAIEDPYRSTVRSALAAAGRELIEIDVAQMHAFCGNVLELADSTGGRHLIMSDRAFTGLNARQRSRLEAHAGIVHVGLATIETHGGGSARCMLAELHAAWAEARVPTED